MSVQGTPVGAGKPPEVSVELLTSHEVARRLGISAQRTRYLLAKGLLPGTRIGRNWVIPRDRFEEYLRGIWTSASQNLQT